MNSEYLAIPIRFDYIFLLFPFWSLLYQYNYEEFISYDSWAMVGRPAKKVPKKVSTQWPNHDSYKLCCYVISVYFWPSSWLKVQARIPTVKLKIPGKGIFEIRNENFCYIQVIVFDLRYLPLAVVGT